MGIADERFAGRMWPDQNPIGKRVMGWGFDSIEIVGVVAHVRNYGVIAESRAELYLPQTQRPYLRMNVILRTSGDPEQVISAARRVLAELELLALSPAEFTIMPLPGVRVVFERDANGKVSQVVLHQGGRVMRATRH